MGKPRFHNPMLKRRILTAPRVFVNPGEVPVPWVQRNRCDAVSVLDQKCFGLSSTIQIGSHIEIWIAEVLKFQVVLVQQHSRNRVTPKNIQFPFGQRSVIQRAWLKV